MESRKVPNPSLTEFLLPLYGIKKYIDRTKSENEFRGENLSKERDITNELERSHSYYKSFLFKSAVLTSAQLAIYIPLSSYLTEKIFQ